MSHGYAIRELEFEIWVLSFEICEERLKWCNEARYGSILIPFDYSILFGVTVP